MPHGALVFVVEHSSVHNEFLGFFFSENLFVVLVAALRVAVLHYILVDMLYQLPFAVLFLLGFEHISRRVTSLYAIIGFIR